VRKICSVSGLKDVIAKQHGSSNPITNARVAMKAFAALKPTSQIRSFAKSANPETPAVIKTEAKAPVAKKAPAKKAAK
jgi:ribosomal protein S5